MEFSCYQAYGFTVCSELPIPLLAKTAPVDNPDITVRQGNPKTNFRMDSGSETLIPGKNHSSILIKDGNEIITALTEKLPVSFFCPTYIGTILHQRGLHALHGTAVCKNGEAVLIVGGHRSGKSSLASEFIKHGWQFMVDDIAILENTGNSFTVRSGVPIQKLCMDTIESLHNHHLILQPVPNQQNNCKYYIDRSSVFYNGKLPVRSIIVLEAADNGLSINKVNGSSKLSLLFPHLLNPATTENDWFDSLQFLLKISTTLPVYQMKRNTIETPEAEYDLIMKTCSLQ